MNRQETRRYLQMTPKQQAENSSRIALDIQRGRALRAMENEALDAALKTKAALLEQAETFAKYGGTLERMRLLDCIDQHDRAMQKLSDARNAS